MDDAGFFSFASFSWMNPIIWKLFRNCLDLRSLSISPNDGSSNNGERLERLWDEEVSRVGPDRASLVRVVMRFQRSKLILSAIASLLLEPILCIGPSVLVHKILGYVESDEGRSVGFGVGLCLALLAAESVKVLLSSLLWATNIRMAIRMKGAFSMLAFRKITRIRAVTTVSVGEVINVLTADSYRMYAAFLVGPFLFLIPSLLLASAAFACYILGCTALIGVSVYLVFLPIQVSFGKVINFLQRKVVKQTDSRVCTMNELLTCVKLIKMYAWEESFAKKISDIRKQEESLLRYVGYVQSMNTSSVPITPALAIILTFLVHTLLGLPLLPSTAFTIIAVFNSMQFFLEMLPFGVKALAEGLVSLGRLKRMLLLRNPEAYVEQRRGLDAAVIMEDASLSWTPPTHTSNGTHSLNGIHTFNTHAFNTHTSNGIHNPNTHTSNGIHTPNTHTSNGIHTSSTHTSNGIHTSSTHTSNGIHTCHHTHTSDHTDMSNTHTSSTHTSNGTHISNTHTSNTHTSNGIHTSNTHTSNGIHTCHHTHTSEHTDMSNTNTSSTHTSNGTHISNTHTSNTHTSNGIHTSNTHTSNGIHTCHHTHTSEHTDMSNTNTSSTHTSNGTHISNTRTSNGIHTSNTHTCHHTYTSEHTDMSNTNTSNGTHTSSDSSHDTQTSEDSLTLRRISFTLPKGNLLGVCGNVGSGKSSLICSILEQMHLHQGRVCVEGSLAYVSQQAWIFHGTVRDNILMGEAFDQHRYDEVIRACSLQPDLATLPHGDQTEIGERGINLSGGQKQRISMARAVYSRRDVYLLDDPLSAVDAHVGKHIFQECIRKSLRGKSVILVTHQLQYLQFCDEVLLLEDGHIKEAGPHSALMKANGRYAQLIANYRMEHTQEQNEEAAAHSLSDETPQPIGVKSVKNGIVNPAFNMMEEWEDGQNGGTCPLMTESQLVKQEVAQEGSVTWRTFKQYCNAAGGFFLLSLVLLGFMLLVGMTAFSDWWLSYWLQQGSGNGMVRNLIGGGEVTAGSITDNPDLVYYQRVYGLTTVAMLVFSIIKACSYTRATLRASSKLHNTMFDKILFSPMSFFDTTPTGRLVNRFSKDQDELDAGLPFNMEFFLQNCLVTTSILLTIVAVFPFMLLVAAFQGLVLTLFLYVFQRGIRVLKREENMSRSPLISLTTSVLQGLSTIHAYDKREQYIHMFRDMTDTNSNLYLLFNSGTSLLCFCLDVQSTLTIFIGALFTMLTPDDAINASLKGLALAYTIQLTRMLKMTIRQSTELEAKFTSAERLLEYITGCVSEAARRVKGACLPEGWPQQGQIEFCDYSMRYRDDTPIILKHMNLSIRAREKLGIVGRTGSGKSSLGVALFRLCEPAGGAVLIDGVNCSSLGLQQLRSQLSIIPQDPVLFTGTVRYNLDPFDKCSDEQIWLALEKTYMKQSIARLSERLQAPVVENGENFSVGERQLMCMARALLRNSRIILLDEATASIDSETDSLVQQTIQEAFRDCTVLTIAHRINTVLHSDRILVMDNGQVAELDSPEVLMQRPNSLFSSLLSAANQVET